MTEEATEVHWTAVHELREQLVCDMVQYSAALENGSLMAIKGRDPHIFGFHLLEWQYLFKHEPAE